MKFCQKISAYPPNDRLSSGSERARKKRGCSSSFRQLDSSPPAMVMQQQVQESNDINDKRHGHTPDFKPAVHPFCKLTQSVTTGTPSDLPKQKETTH
ncbi:hypothetical protein CEXT_363361 [Caerostris extrusa]|uniref:Uncharacterized protein n=1 Tax=Caerostris extrusa TaxID=172846 RepID=A0AAV4SXZ6_CAEEX|nr:hypothetical protein CEXT_363361 [Caerostris extrusa]